MNTNVAKTYFANISVKQKAGTPDGLIQVSIGLEDVEDLVEDFRVVVGQGLPK